MKRSYSENFKRSDQMQDNQRKQKLQLKEKKNLVVSQNGLQVFKIQLFQSFQRLFLKSKLNTYLTCPLCKGFFRLAETVVECGHTFCKLCVHEHLRKNKKKQCPSCMTQLEQYYQKSLKSDTFIQSLVDILHPQFAKKDTLIGKRVRKVLPGIDLELILDTYNSRQNQSKRGKQKKRTPDGYIENLRKHIEEKFNITFDQFVNICTDENESKFKELEEKVYQLQKSKLSLAKSANQTIEFYLHPQTKRDHQIAGLKCTIKCKHPLKADLAKIRRTIFDTAIKKNKNIENSLINIERFEIGQILLLDTNDEYYQQNFLLQELYLRGITMKMLSGMKNQEIPKLKIKYTIKL